MAISESGRLDSSPEPFAVDASGRLTAGARAAGRVYYIHGFTEATRKLADARRRDKAPRAVSKREREIPLSVSAELGTSLPSGPAV